MTLECPLQRIVQKGVDVLPQDICAKCLRDVELCNKCGLCKECCDVEEHKEEEEVSDEF